MAIPPNDISSEMDWLHWGVIISTALFGTIIVQAWTYFNNNNDRWHLRVFITILMSADIWCPKI
ncbi:hypothetical protein L208DRAFT_1395204 [Tricholoma matsutake]|nr:hypothetical protein L208DRAFT_1395204 [Tricholoma matsutake 945]